MGPAQSLADGIKLALKEDIIPALADKPVYFLAPVIVRHPRVHGLRGHPVRRRGVDLRPRTALQITDFPVAVLLILACSSFGVYGIVLAGWSTGSTYPLLGGLRSSAQMISYEVAMGLAMVPVFLTAGSMSTSEIVESQHHALWYALALPPSFVIYLIAVVGETNRAPFDLPEAESELVGGFHTEYSSLKFAMFFLAEYINMTTVSALATTLFLGGWRPPGRSRWHRANLDGWWRLLWFRIKVCLAAVLLHLAARHAAPAALRPVHAAGLEGPDPDQPGLAAHGRGHQDGPRGDVQRQPGLDPGRGGCARTS